MKKRIWKSPVALLLAVLLLLSACPVQVLAAGSAGQTEITVNSVTARAGSTVEVTVDVKNNPGILGATLTLSYGNRLTLQDAQNGEAFSPLTLTKPGAFTSPCNFVWDGTDLTEGQVKNGTILTLTFAVSPDAQPGDAYGVELSVSDGDITDKNMVPVEVAVTNGSVTVTSFQYGDLDDNRKVNTTDVILLRRHLAGGYAVTINEQAADVDLNGKINTTDVIYIRRHLAGGYGIDNLPVGGKTCQHKLVETPYKAATCTEEGNNAYYTCSLCGKYYADAAGARQITLQSTVLPKTEHHIVTVKGTPATETSPGLSDGEKCDLCGQWFQEQVVLPQLEKDSYNITYKLNDEYLNTLTGDKAVQNPNPVSYSSKTGLRLQNIETPGYDFLGWYDMAGSTGVRVTQIAAGETGDVTLYAHWEKKEYTITFDSNLAPIPSVTYTTDKATALRDPVLLNYTFTGWTTEDGKYIGTTLPKGTTGNITLKANWTSKRNQTRPVKKLADPIIYHDEENGKILMAYEIGTIENVPLFTIEYMGNKVSGIDYTETTEVTTAVGQEQREEILSAVSEATTNTYSWTLSSELSKITEKSEEHQNEISSEHYHSETAGRTEDGRWIVGGSESNYHSAVANDGTSYKVTTNESQDVEASLGAKMGVPNASVSAELKAGMHWSEEDIREGYSNRSTTDTTTWNTNAGFESSYSSSSNSTTSQRLGQAIRDKATYSVSDSVTEGKSTSQSDSETKTNTRQNANSLQITTEEITKKSRTYTNANAPEGYYRSAAATTLHVYGVVTYDIALQAFSAYSYSIAENDVYEFLDYSMSTPKFNDNENGILPFDIPIDVYKYVQSVCGASDGLVINADTGVVEEYINSPDVDKLVVIPDYYAVDKGNGREVIKVTGLKEDAFTGNENIVGVKLSASIKSIPDRAFAGCTNLKSVIAPAVTEIGNSAFAGCTALKEYQVSNKVTAIGETAFTGVQAITVQAKNTAVVRASLSSGARRIKLNLSSLEDPLTQETLCIPAGTDYFELTGEDSKGNPQEYPGVKLVSDAEETVLNGLSFTQVSGNALKLSSPKVTLRRVTADATGWALILTAENTDLALYGKNELVSAKENAAISRTVFFRRANPNVVGTLTPSGCFLVYGTVPSGKSYVTDGENKIKFISREEFEAYRTKWEAGTVTMTLEPWGGTIPEKVLEVQLGSPIGELPVPVKTGCDFFGWFRTLPAGHIGEQITAETVLEDAEDIKIEARYRPKSYTVAWNEAEGCDITVEIEELNIMPSGRPEMIWTENRQTGVITSGSTVEYDDRLKITYTPKPGYRITSTGITSVSRVNRDYTSSDIYAITSADIIAYTVKCVSTNGTNLGSYTVEKPFGSTNTVSPPTKAGYNTPASQTVAWDALEKTITFRYQPAAVASNTQKSGLLYDDPYTTWDANMEIRNRTANSVEIWLDWNEHMAAYGHNSFGQYCRMMNHADNFRTIADFCVVPYGEWGHEVSYQRDKNAGSGWIRIPLNTTNQTVIPIEIYFYQQNANGLDVTSEYGYGGASFMWDVPVPAY